jgi:hypothetical protein
MSKTAEMYDLTTTLDLDALSSLHPGSTILVSNVEAAPDDIVHDVLVDGARAGDGAIGVSTDGDGADWAAHIDRESGGFPDHSVGVIDCQAEGGREHTQLENGTFHYSVPGPTDLTGIGIGITNCVTHFEEMKIDGARLGLTSLSTILTATDRKTTFKFCHVLASRLDAAGLLGVFSIDASAHDKQTLQILKQAFDGAVELRDNGKTREARVRGLGESTAAWTPIRLDG